MQYDTGCLFSGLTSATTLRVARFLNVVKSAVFYKNFRITVSLVVPEATSLSPPKALFHRFSFYRNAVVT